MTRRSRSGLSMLEIAIVLAIIGIMAAIGNTLLSESLPSWRTRRAAQEFAAALNQCRQMAIAQGVQYRIRMSSFDNDLDGTSPSQGAYFVERGDLASGSSSWDILPVDMDGSGANFGEGTVVISEGGEDALKGVSISDWGSIAGVEGNDIVFSPRGWLDNPATDFNSDGYIEITFVNKPARARGAQDDWTVMVTRGGMVRLESNRMSPVGGASGTPSASEWTTSSGGGGS